MRVLVCGDREWDDEDIIGTILLGYLADYGSLHPVTVIHGGARGADDCASRIADTFSGEEPTIIDGDTHYFVEEPYSAHWDTFGKSAGPIRNQEMLDKGHPDVVLAFHDNLAGSKGTRDMVDRAKAAGVPVYLISHA